MTAPVAASGRPRLLLQPSGKWEVDHGEYRCEIRRVLAGPDGTPYLLSLPLEPFNDVIKLRLTRKEKPSRGQRGDAVMAIDGVPYADAVPVQIFSNGDLRTRQYRLDLGRHPLHEGKGKLVFKGMGGDVEVVAEQWPAAWRAASTCLADLASDVGIDPAVMRTVATPPRGELLDFVTQPSRGGVTQFVVVYWVNIDGRVDDCRLVKSSGRKFFDDDICKHLRARGRFKPAVGVDGKPMRSPRYDNIVLSRFFLIYDDQPGSGKRVGDPD